MSFFKKLKKLVLPAAAVAGSFLLPGVGTALGGSLLSGLGSIGGILGTAGNVGSLLSGAGAIGSLLGNNNNPKAPQPVVAAQAKPFTPVKPAAVARPNTLADYSGFDPQQERTALATKGLNQGLGKQEQDYYTNMVQRSLIGDNNVPSADTSGLSPVESQYFSQQGINTSDIMKFLQQLQGGV